MYNPTKPYKKAILEIIARTWETPYISVRNGIVEKKFSYPEYSHIDGIGTKGIYHWKHKSFRNAVIDAMAMNLNDLALMRAIPYQIIDHLFLPEDSHNTILGIIRYLATECKRRDIAITAGETAIHSNMELELSITMLGFIKEQKQNQFRVGDALIGIESNGLHSNGFTKVREIFGEEYRREFILPTNIYLDTILNLDKRFDIHGLAHITGGAFSRLRDSLDKNGNVKITRSHRLKPHEIFYKLYERGISDEEMYKTFNCGIGFILSVDKKDAKEVLYGIEDFKSDVIGEITFGNGKIEIESMFSNEIVEI